MSRKALFNENPMPFLHGAAHEAGAAIMRHYRNEAAVSRKEDASPVTEADKEADRIIVAALRPLNPDILIVSEEGEHPDVTRAECFWLVDPLDGTRSFIRGTGHFTVNIALVEKGVPVLGVIYDPVGRDMYWGDGTGAFHARAEEATHAIHARPRPYPSGTALISHRSVSPQADEYLIAEGITERIPLASSIKFCLLAEGKADLYVRFGPTMEWDIAAGHAILSAAGGSVSGLDGLQIPYGKPGFLNGSFVARGR